jgi:hypothetical protein
MSLSYFSAIFEDKIYRLFLLLVPLLLRGGLTFTPEMNIAVKMYEAGAKIFHLLISGFHLVSQGKICCCEDHSFRVSAFDC